MVSAGQPTILVRNAEVDGCGGVDIRVGPNRIEQVGIRLGAHPGDQVLDAAGGAVIPGLHDHHVHLRAVVAARASVDVSAAPDAAAFDRLIAAAALTATPGRWLRVTGWHEQRAGWLDRARLDALAGTVPIRVQHRTGVMWVMNSAALHAAGAGDCDLDGVERDRDGAATGRLLRMDAWLRTRLTAIGADYGSVGFADGLAAYAEACAQLGITGFTDATPGRDQADVDEFCQLSAAGAFAQRLILMAPPGLKHPASGRVTLGPMKVVLDDTTLPTVAELALRITDAHGLGVAVAVHCVTAEQLVVSVAAFQQAGPAPAGKADRIEHAAVVPPGYADDLARLGLAVVTQPGFLYERGDDYLQHVPTAEQDWLYPCASLLRAGIAVAAGSDAPFGPADPWLGVAAATARRTAAGAVLGVAERVGAPEALRLYLAAPGNVRHARSITPGQPGDICVLRAPLKRVLADPPCASVLATIVGGRLLRAS